LEVRVPVGKVDEVVRRLIAVHPYRVPAYDVTTLRPVREQPAGRVGRLAAPTTFAEFVNAVDGYLDTRSWAWGSPDTRVRKVAVVGGAADSEWMAAQRTGADVLLTGEVKQHVALEAVESGMCLIAAGHYATEQPGVVALAKRLSTEMPEVNWQVFEPAPGGAGRPQ
jgi:putative NIF3 family GTP cyclohydrolase 1 type 2